MNTKYKTLADAVNSIKDGDTIFIGGVVGRHPTASVFEVISQQKKDLTIISATLNNCVKLLIAGNCTNQIYVSEYTENLNDSLIANSEQVKVVKTPLEVLLEGLKAGVEKIDFSVVKPSLTPQLNSEYTRDITCPFTRQKYLAVRAINPDVAFIHAHKADIYGNVHFDRNRLVENDVDLLIAKSAKYTIVTVEQIVDPKSINHHPSECVLSAEYVGAVVEAPYGAYPSSCDNYYSEDFNHQAVLNTKFQLQDGIASYLRDYVFDVENWKEFLNKIGTTKLLQLSHYTRTNDNVSLPLLKQKNEDFRIKSVLSQRN